jgi:predicted permease
MPAFWQRLVEFVRTVRLDRELHDELRFHLDMLEQQYRARGMTEAEARAAARREFGGLAHTQEAYRDQRGFPWLETIVRDLCYSVRGLRRSPGFTAAAVLSLALGIGANTAIFSLFHALMLRLLPVERPEELVDLYKTGGWISGHSSYPLYEAVAKRHDLFKDVAARAGIEPVRFRERPNARENFALREFVSGNYFQLLGVQPALGRLFTPDDNRIPGGHPLAVLSYDCWRTRFGAHPAVLGSTVIVAEKPLTVIGVAAPGFYGVQVERRTDVWVPILMAEMPFKSPSTWWVQIVARARPEIPRKRLQAAVDILMQQYLAATYPTGYNAAFRKRIMQQRLEVRDAGIGLSLLRDRFAKPLQVLMVAVVLVLLIACANVANLLLARGVARRKEMAMRLSLGAARSRLVRQALVESLLLAAAATALGIGIGGWGAHVLLHFLPEQAGAPASSTLEPVVLAFTVAVSVISVLLFGIAPALRSTAVSPAESLRSQAAASVRTPPLRRALVILQVAFSVVLVILAGLFGHSLFELRSVDLGFRNQNVLAFMLDFPRAWRGQRLQVPYQQLADRLHALPGVSSVSYGFPGPFQMGRSSASIRVPGSAVTAAEPVDVAVAQVAPQYFATIGCPLLLGREFDRYDLASSKVAVVNEAFVRAFLPGEPHPDRRFFSFDDSKPEGGERTAIVGVVHDIRTDAIQQDPRPTVYLPAGSNINFGLYTMLVRTKLPSAALLPALYRETGKLGPSIVVRELATLRQHIDDSIFEQRLLATISGFFGALALLLAGIGLYGVVSYGAVARTAEIGVRMALGARPSQVVHMVLRDSLGLVAFGLILGLAASAVAARLVASVLFGVRPSDSAAFAFTALALLATGLTAAFLPARRAAALDPMRALRHE